MECGAVGWQLRLGSKQLALIYVSEGMDLNPIFASAAVFCPVTTGGSSCSSPAQVSHLFTVGLLTAAAVLQVGHYSSAMNLIMEADVLTDGLLISDGDGGSVGPSSPSINLMDVEQCKVEDGECWIPFGPCTLV